MYFYSVSSILYCDLSISFDLFLLLYIYSVYVCPWRIQCPLFAFSFLFLKKKSIHVACICLSLFLLCPLSLSLFLITWRFRTTYTLLQYIWHLSFFFFSRWNMNDIQLDYVKPTKNVSVGIYGWRKRCLYCLLIVLTIIVCINVCLTLWLSLVLGLHWVRRVHRLFVNRNCCVLSREVLDLSQYLKTT